MRRSPDARDDR
jgi:transposase